ncbi:MAG: tetratricopeptide repeat protein [Sulfuricaulis sp.]
MRSIVSRDFGSHNRNIILPDGSVASVPHAIRTAIQFHQGRQARKAAEIYDRVLQVEPDNTDALHLKGLIAHQSGRQEIAVALISKAIELNPNVAMYHNNLAATYLAMNMPFGAIVECEKALTLQPDSHKTFYVMGRALLSAGKLAEAASAIEQFLKHEPNFIDAYAVLAEILCRLGRAEEALTRCDNALSACPDNPILVCAVGNVLRKLGRVDELITHYEQAVTMRPEFAQGH